jgi:hypothetical protein
MDHDSLNRLYRHGQRTWLDFIDYQISIDETFAHSDQKYCRSSLTLKPTIYEKAIPETETLRGFIESAPTILAANACLHQA